MEMESLDVTKLRSNEEGYVYWYLEELYKRGFIDLIEYESESFALGEDYYGTRLKEQKSKVKEENFRLVAERAYTYDFKIRWTEKARNVFFRNVFALADPDVYFISNLREDNREYSYLEVKGTFDINSKITEVRIKIDWVWYQHKKYVQLTQPIPKVSGLQNKVSPLSALFYATFVPLRYFYTDKSGAKRKIGFATRTLDEYLEHCRLLERKYI